jgi:hypothetical protein
MRPITRYPATDRPERDYPALAEWCRRHATAVRLVCHVAWNLYNLCADPADFALGMLASAAVHLANRYLGLALPVGRPRTKSTSSVRSPATTLQRQTGCGTTAVRSAWARETGGSTPSIPTIRTSLHLPWCHRPALPPLLVAAR